jgi:hypothetical protein
MPGIFLTTISNGFRFCGAWAVRHSAWTDRVLPVSTFLNRYFAGKELGNTPATEGTATMQTDGK